MLSSGTASTAVSASPSLPVLDLSWADNPAKKPVLLQRLHDALFNIGFLYVVNHGISSDIVSALTSRLPLLFDLPDEQKNALSKIHSPHFLGYSGFAKETTLGKQDLREQFDFATELPTVKDRGTDNNAAGRDLPKLHWNLRGPNQWPPEELLPGFKKAFTESLAHLSYRFVHLVEEAFSIPVGTFDHFFGLDKKHITNSRLPPPHRIKLVKYPPSSLPNRGQGVGAHKDSSGWLTFLFQIGRQECLEVLNTDGEWILAPSIDNSFVVNFGNAMEAATEGAVKATVHRVTVAWSCT